ncbi:MAG TPA: hypothetical protein VFQ13_17730 [Anaerolineales bacterium]|nr:hypothetical protein [Anaerolineales bacterium]
MKTILRIIMILLVASAVAGAFSLAVNNTAIAADIPREGGGPPAMTDANGQSFQPMERPEGDDHEGGSLAQGLSGVLATLLKLTGITVLVLLLQKAFDLPDSLKWKLVQR